MSHNYSKNNQNGNDPASASASASVAVVVRVRPMAKTELKRGCSVAVERATDGSPQISVNRKKWFKFNHVFDHTDTQKDIFETCVQAKVRKLLDGYNVTILAYGQTGSGKTYTMDTACNGVLDDSMGVIPRAVHSIFQHIGLLKDEYEFSVACSFVELYLEHSFDLFSPRKSPVKMHESENRILMPGLTKLEVSSAQEVTRHLMKGCAKRTVASTAMSRKSSRSHAIFTITIEARKLCGGADSVTTAKFNLVDLAGSERCTKTLARGDRFKEGVNINKSLLALGNVLNALGSAQTPPAHVPYRQSKLTRLLQESLGGNSITLMIACVSPSDYNVAETLSTLRYANRTLQIKNRPVINMIPPVDEFDIQQQRRELQATGESRPKSSADNISGATEDQQSADDGGVVDALMEQMEQIKLAFHDLQMHSQEARPQLNDGRGDEVPLPKLLGFQPEQITSEQMELIDELRTLNQTLEQKQLLYDFICCNYSEQDCDDGEAGADLLAKGRVLLNQLCSMERKDTSGTSAEKRAKQMQLLQEQIIRHLTLVEGLRMRREDRNSLSELNAEMKTINESKWHIIQQYRQSKMESNEQQMQAESKDRKPKGKKTKKCEDAQATPPKKQLSHRDGPDGQLSAQTKGKSDSGKWIDDELDVILALVDAEHDMADREAITNEYNYVREQLANADLEETKKARWLAQIGEEQELRNAHLDDLQQKASIKDLDSRLRSFTSENIDELREIHQKTLNALVLQRRQQVVWQNEQQDLDDEQSALQEEKDEQIEALTRHLSQAKSHKEELMQKVSLLLRSHEALQQVEEHLSEHSDESGDSHDNNEEFPQPIESAKEASGRSGDNGSEE
ncbi:chromosome-associated kinesin KIF4-like [Drosophila obscura]|uniref:chromosome-associated kinesin KIF4-like n=1 Tax=Drosophila obscura TaxID=7282 RepID=UPI001BB1E592|nr:chromosome-associated kinesin KIF4-like [Drosophila obscura]